MSIRMVVHSISPISSSEKRFEREKQGPAARTAGPNRLGSVWKRDPRHPGTTEKPRALVHAIVHMQDELRRRARDSVAVRDMIERPLQFGMLRDVLANFVKALARRLQTLFELRLGLYLGFAQRHLRPAVRVDFAFARGFDGKENHVLELVHHRRLHSVRLR